MLAYAALRELPLCSMGLPAEHNGQQQRPLRRQTCTGLTDVANACCGTRCLFMQATSTATVNPVGGQQSTETADMSVDITVLC